MAGKRRIRALSGLRRAGAPGYTLVEVTVAMLILAMVSTGIFSVVLTARTNQVRSDLYQMGAVYAQRLRDHLRNYIGVRTGEDPAWVCTRRGGGANCKRMKGDTCTDAFTVGCTHNAGCAIPSWFRSTFDGRMCYDVFEDEVPAGSGRKLSRLQIKVEWQEASPTCPSPPADTSCD